MTDQTSPALQAIRAEIDRIDDAILRLVEERLAAAAAVDAAKSEEADGRLRFRPRRQAEVVRRLARGDEVWVYDLKEDPRRLRLILPEDQVRKAKFVPGDVTDLAVFSVNTAGAATTSLTFFRPRS